MTNFCRISMFLFIFAIVASMSMFAAEARVQPGTLAPSVAAAAPTATAPVIVSRYSPAVVKPEKEGNRFVRVIKNHPKTAFLVGTVGTFVAVALVNRGGADLRSSRDPGYRTVAGRSPCAGDPRACGIGVGGGGGR